MADGLRLEKTPFRLLAGVSLLAVLIAIARVAYVLPRHSFINDDNASGTWATLAMDFAQGVLYRDVLSARGYGGTRYFPVEFSLHAGLIKLGLPVAAAGHIVGVSAVLLLLVSAYALLRELSVRPYLAAACMGLLTVTYTTGIALTRVGSDALAAAFTFAGAALAVRFVSQGRPGWMLALPASLFASAFLSKQSSLMGLGAVCLWLLLERRPKQGWLLGALAVGVAALGVALFNHLSNGRMIGSGTLAKGAITGASMLSGPFKFFRFMRQDLLLLMPMVAAVYVIARYFRETWRELPTLLLLFSAAAMCVIYGQPGTESNHLIELAAPALVFFAYQIHRGRLSPRLGPGLLVGAGLINCVLMIAFGFKLPWYTVADTRPEYAKMRAIVGSEGGPVVCENPWNCILLGETPYVMDAMALRLWSAWTPVRDDFNGKMDRRFFRALVLRTDIREASARAWYSDLDEGPGFPAGFVDKALENYEFKGEFASNFVFVRKAPAAP